MFIVTTTDFLLSVTPGMDMAEGKEENMTNMHFISFVYSDECVMTLEMLSKKMGSELPESKYSDFCQKLLNEKIREKCAEYGIVEQDVKKEQEKKKQEELAEIERRKREIDKKIWKNFGWDKLGGLNDETKNTGIRQEDQGNENR